MRHQNYTQKYKKLAACIALLTTIIGCGVGYDGGTFSKLPFGFPKCSQDGVQIFGVVRYVDRGYDNHGFNRTRIEKAVGYVDIEIVRDVENPTHDDIVGVGAADANGRYCITIINPGNNKGVRVKAYASTFNSPQGLADELPGFSLQVKTTARSDNGYIYSVTSDHVNDTASDTIRVDILSHVFLLNENSQKFDKQGVGGVFNIMDTMTRAFRKMKAIVPEDIKFNALQVEWKSETRIAAKNGTFGSFFQSGARGGADFGIISVNGGNAYDSGDHDEYDDDVILHEFGHYMVANAWSDSSRGGQHFLTGTDQDTRLAWSEGWATFFSCAMRNDPLIVDTLGGDVPEGAISVNFSYNIEDYQLKWIDRSLLGKYTTSEVTVSGVLWDIFDNMAEAHDSINTGLGLIVNAQNTFFDTATGTSANNINFFTFLDGWVAANGASSIEQLTPVLANSSIEYWPDPFEKDDTFEQASPIAVKELQHHTLFPKKDIDFLMVELKQGLTYAITTRNLINGADTAMELYDENMSLIAGNDNSTNKNYILCLRVGDRDAPCPRNGAYHDPQPGVVSPNPGPAEGWYPGESELSSRITYIAKKTGRYYVKIASSDVRVPSVSDYGSYDFTIIELTN